MIRAPSWLALIAVACGAAPDDTSPVDSDVAVADSDVVDSEVVADTVPVDTGEVGDRIRALGPLLWLEASDVALAEGGRLEAWPGRGDGTVAATQALVERQPRLRVVDGTPRVRFDGVDDRLELGAVAVEGAYTFAVVVAAGAASGALVGGPSATDALGLDDGRPSLQATGGTAPIALVADAPLTPGLHLVVGVVAARSSTLWVDGVSVRTSSRRPIPAALDLAIGALSLRGPAQGAVAADVASVVILDRAVGGCERRALEQGLAALHGLTVTPSSPVPMTWFVADDAPGDVHDVVGTWTARPTSDIAAVAVAASLDHQPTLERLAQHRALRFDGVDDRLDLNVPVLVGNAVQPLTLAVVLVTGDASGHVVGTGASVDGRLLSYGTGLVVDGGAAVIKGVADGTGVVVRGAEIADGAPHVLLGDLDLAGAGVAVDTAAERGVGTASVFPFARATLGASDGSVADAAVDPLAADVADVRVWGGPLDTCDRMLLYQETLRAYGAPSPAGPNLPR